MSERGLFQAFALDLPAGDDSAPVVVARGEYASAEHMVAVAKKYGIPVVEKPELCAALEPLSLDESIPQKLFEAAAALLVEIGVLRAQSGHSE
jgi:flagellar biosynthesis protein